MSADLGVLAPTLILVVLAGFTTYVTGGAIWIGLFSPRDATMRRVARATWWVSPTLVAGGSVLAAHATRGKPLIAGIVLAAGVACVSLCWRWRPGRADELRSPEWIVRLRSSVAVPVRDGAAWRRQLVELLVAVTVLVVPLVALRMG